MSQITKENFVEYIHDYAFEFGRLWNTKLSPVQKIERIAEKMTSPEEYFELIKKHVEISNMEAVQDYLLEHGTNDEDVNDSILVLRGLKKKSKPSLFGLKPQTSTGWVIANENHPNNPNPFLVTTTFSATRAGAIKLFIEGSGSSWNYWKRKYNFKCIRSKNIIIIVK